MADKNENQFELNKPRAFGYQLKLRKPELRLTQQTLQLSSASPGLWVAPMRLQVQKVGNRDMLQVTGKVINAADKRSYLTQTPVSQYEPSVRLSLYTDNTPDPFTHNEQFSIGLKGFGFGGEGKLFVQGGSDQPHVSVLDPSQANNMPVKYNSFQLNIAPGQIPLVILDNVSLAPQLGLDMQSGSPSLGLEVDFKSNFLKSISINLNNLNTDWKRKLGADSVQVIFEIPFPDFF